MRWIVGDVQGCADELVDLLSAIDFRIGQDELWIAGDLINRGPRSLETLRLWAALGGKAVLGNHDLYALAAWRGLRERKPDDTLDALFDADDRDALMARLAACPSLVRLESNGAVPAIWLVHAGLSPTWKKRKAAAKRLNKRPKDGCWLDDQDVWLAATVRCTDKTGKPVRGSGPRCGPETVPWWKHYDGKTLVVHGHWATRGHYRRKHTLGLDSGCVYGGPLTAWCQDEDRIVQVPARTTHR